MSAPLDARGLRCPWPVLRLAAAMRNAESMTIMVDDPSAPDEIAAFASSRGWRYGVDDRGNPCVEKHLR